MFDANGDSELQLDELPPSFLGTFFKTFDGNGNGGIDAKEYNVFKEFSQPFHKGMSAFKPGGTGDLSETNVAWSESGSMPRTPSALCYDGVLFTLSEGGVLQSFAADSGELLSKQRVEARGNIYSSPALGDGKIYLGSRDGEIAVVSAEAEPQNLHSANIGGDIQASVAIANGRIFFRTGKALVCFGKK
jgi:outer membrane protein assembly factor BamB